MGTITIGNTVVDESLWDIVSDGNKGVYINLAQVPEPAEWAMIFGLLALGFVSYRKRK
ncbi:MAG: PEP-CTERM sorting domain-containing protein [Opitutales bacterium]|nr:PEP-CTERM sorting domain-containing protein [Opitutales bacterium]